MLSFSFSEDALLERAHQVSYQHLLWPALEQYQIKVYLRRDDLVSNYYPGNKFYKLYHSVRQALEGNYGAIVSFGGAWSNHIHALAYVGQQYQLPTVGIIRGAFYRDRKSEDLTSTLQDAVSFGMELLFLEKDAYRLKAIDQFEKHLKDQYGHYLLLPEGGATENALRGCQALGQAIGKAFKHSKNYQVCCAVGTGTTLAGLATGLPSSVPCLGFSALKGEDSLTASIDKMMRQQRCARDNWQVISDFHHGGYGKITPELIEFMEALEDLNNIRLEPVYTAKMLWGIQQLAEQAYWKPGTELVAIHTGGLQGRRGFNLRP